jgi:hypothetical protein
LAGNPVKPLLSLYGTEWRERGYGLWKVWFWSNLQYLYRSYEVVHYTMEPTELDAVTFVIMDIEYVYSTYLTDVTTVGKFCVHNITE